MRSQWLQTAPREGWLTTDKYGTQGNCPHIPKNLKKKFNVKWLVPSTAGPNSIDIAEGKGKGGQATELLVKNPCPKTRLGNEKKGVRKGPTPRQNEKKRTHRPFDVDALRGRVSAQSGGPTVTSWPNPAIHGGHSV